MTEDIQQEMPEEGGVQGRLFGTRELVKGQSRDLALDVFLHPSQSPLTLGRPRTLSFVIHFLCRYHFI